MEDLVRRAAAEVRTVYGSLAIIIVGGICAEATLYRRYKKYIGEDVGILESIGYGIRYVGDSRADRYGRDECNETNIDESEVQNDSAETL